MSLFQKVMCALDRHEPKRSDVHWDGKRYRAECRHCGSDIVRLARKTWRKAKEPG